MTIILLFASLGLQIAGLTFVVLIDPYLHKRYRRIMLLIIAMVTSLVAQNVADARLADTSMYNLRMAVSVYGYLLRPLVILLYFYVIDKREWLRLGWALVLVNGLLYVTSPWTHLCFWIDESNHFQRGPLGFCCHVVCILMLLNLAFITFRRFDHRLRAETWLLFFIVGTIFAAMLIDLEGYVSFYEVMTLMAVVMVNDCLFFYIWLHLQFVRQHEQDFMAQQRIQVMMSQIQPHFLYNTLATIQALCTTSPEKAADTAEKFGAYLRQNLDSLGQTGKIPFVKELEHTRIYSDIEKIRFENIRVEFDIQDDDFEVPPLSLQPLVENAIRHGVRIREKGLVQVTTRKVEGYHEIVIRDNGKGFHPEAIESFDRSHIGLRNVRERIEKMCQGTFDIDSRIGEGTTITVRIPE